MLVWPFQECSVVLVEGIESIGRKLYELGIEEDDAAYAGSGGSDVLQIRPDGLDSADHHVSWQRLCPYE